MIASASLCSASQRRALNHCEERLVVSEAEPQQRCNLKSIILYQLMIASLLLFARNDKVLDPQDDNILKDIVSLSKDRQALPDRLPLR
jgi:hypothetical protein